FGAAFLSAIRVKPPSPKAPLLLRRGRRRLRGGRARLLGGLDLLLGELVAHEDEVRLEAPQVRAGLVDADPPARVDAAKKHILLAFGRLHIHEAPPPQCARSTTNLSRNSRARRLDSSSTLTAVTPRSGNPYKTVAPASMWMVAC